MLTISQNKQTAVIASRERSAPKVAEASTVEDIAAAIASAKDEVAALVRERAGVETSQAEIAEQLRATAFTKTDVRTALRSKASDLQGRTVIIDRRLVELRDDLDVADYAIRRARAVADAQLAVHHRDTLRDGADAVLAALGSLVSALDAHRKAADRADKEISDPATGQMRVGARGTLRHEMIATAFVWPWTEINADSVDRFRSEVKRAFQ